MDGIAAVQERLRWLHDRLIVSLLDGWAAEVKACADALDPIREALEHDLRDVEAARELIRRDAEFQEWAQSYLNSARWAGHDRSDAIKTELLERDKQLADAHYSIREALEQPQAGMLDRYPIALT